MHHNIFTSRHGAGTAISFAAMTDSPFFIVTPASRLLPLTQIVPREAPDPVRVRRAHTLMRAAAQGAGPKRQPLAVRPREDGSYQLVDGNTTFQALLELGEQEAVVEIIA